MWTAAAAAAAPRPPRRGDAGDRQPLSGGEVHRRGDGASKRPWDCIATREEKEGEQLSPGGEGKEDTRLHRVQHGAQLFRGTTGGDGLAGAARAADGGGRGRRPGRAGPRLRAWSRGGELPLSAPELELAPIAERGHHRRHAVLGGDGGRAGRPHIGLRHGHVRARPRRDCTRGDGVTRPRARFLSLARAGVKLAPSRSRSGKFGISPKKKIRPPPSQGRFNDLNQ